jgi:hypothetical protein
MHIRYFIITKYGVFFVQEFTSNMNVLLCILSNCLIL